MKTANDNRIPQAFMNTMEVLLLISPFLFGLFFPWASTLAVLALCALSLLLLRCRPLSIPSSPCFLCACAIVLFQLLGVFYGADQGMAPLGAVQFLPLPLFVLLMEQLSCETRFSLLRKMPYFACAMVILSLLLSHIPPMDRWFLVAGRQAGFFQYPNTYAGYLLLAVVLVLFGEPLRYGRVPWLVILLAGIILSGSRIAFVITGTVLALYLIREKNRTSRRGVLVTGLVLLASSVLYVVLTGNRESIGRFLTISPSASEFLGRLLYARDAIPVILRHPFGLGYMGYRWLQGSFQTGDYTVRFVHNEFLQLMLDVGWIPGGLFLWALIRSFRSREGGFCRKLFLSVLCIHSLMDFDTQFVAVTLMLFLAMDVDMPSKRHVKTLFCIPVLTVLSLCSVWIGAASFLCYLGRPSSALRIYPFHTEALIELLSDDGTEDLEETADRVLRLNDHVALAHNVKARLAFSRGSFSEMKMHKMRVLMLAKYNLDEYLDYFGFLIYSYGIYHQNGEDASAAQCLSLMGEIPLMLEAVKNQTSSLGWKIDDKPNLDLPDSYLPWLSEFQDSMHH